jgi:cytochrome c oxidase subunit III
MSTHAVDPVEPAVEGVYNGKLAMWLFLCSEVMFFSGVLGAYIALRLGNPSIFEASQQKLHHHVGLAAFNTVLLIASSLTMALGVLAGQKKETGKQRMYLLITAIAGAVFLVLKGFEYSTHFANNEVPSTDIFFAFYYTATGIHAVHILGGVIPIMGLWWFAKNKDVSCETEMTGLYWHFVDLVWIFLFPMLYLI